MWYITLWYYPALKKDKTIYIAGKWIEIEKKVLNEGTQTQKGKHHMLSWIVQAYIFQTWVYNLEKLLKTESKKELW